MRRRSESSGSASPRVAGDELEPEELQGSAVQHAKQRLGVLPPRGHLRYETQEDVQHAQQMELARLQHEQQVALSTLQNDQERECARRAKELEDARSARVLEWVKIGAALVIAGAIGAIYAFADMQPDRVRDLALGGVLGSAIGYVFKK